MKNIILTAILIASAVSADSNTTGAPTVTQLFNVKTVKVKKEKSSRVRNYYGFVVAEEPLRVEVSPRFGGYIEKLYADSRYLEVKKGDVLATVYSPEVLQAKEEYLNTIKFSEKRSSPAMMRSAKSKLELMGVPEKEIKDIEKSSRISRLTSIVSPVSGWIFQKSVNAGSSFKAGKKIFEIVDLKKVWIEARIYQKDLPLLRELSEFSIEATGAEGRYRARKLLLYPNFDPKEATAVLRLEAENEKGELKPGMYATLFASAKARERLLIPRTAAIRKNGKWYAFLASEYEGEYEPVEIEIEPVDKEHYQVLGGLKEGDEVVDNSLFLMDSDAQINGLY